MDQIAKLKEIVDGSSNIVFFGGAGVSTESGIPDFRSVDGLYNQKYDYPPETILSHTFYRSRPEEFFRFYQDKMLCLTAKPNAAHKTLARWEQGGKRPESWMPLSPRTLTAFIRWRAAGRSWSFMEACCVITVKNAAHSMMRNSCCMPGECPNVKNAAAG